MGGAGGGKLCPCTGNCGDPRCCRHAATGRKRARAPGPRDVAKHGPGPDHHNGECASCSGENDRKRRRVPPPAAVAGAVVAAVAGVGVAVAGAVPKAAGKAGKAPAKAKAAAGKAPAKAVAPPKVAAPVVPVVACKAPAAAKAAAAAKGGKAPAKAVAPPKAAAPVVPAAAPVGHAAPAEPKVVAPKAASASGPKPAGAAAPEAPVKPGPVAPIAPAPRPPSVKAETDSEPEPTQPSKRRPEAVFPPREIGHCVQPADGKEVRQRAEALAQSTKRPLALVLALINGALALADPAREVRWGRPRNDRLDTRRAADPKPQTIARERAFAGGAALTDIATAPGTAANLASIVHCIARMLRSARLAEQEATGDGAVRAVQQWALRDRFAAELAAIWTSK